MNFHQNIKASVIAAAAICSIAVQADDGKEQRDDNRLVVTAEFENTELSEFAGSATVLDQQIIDREQATSLDEILSIAPNVNFATGASRGRFIQIRGIGERSEFVEPVNYSVGVVVDGIDMTGIAMGATLLDVAQVEILRGPQGTLYGANALAGLINVVSHDASDQYEADLDFGLSQYGGQRYSAVISGPASDNLGYRLALGQVKSDGFIQNDFLNRDDTNNIDETTLKAQFDYQATDDFSLKTHILWLDINNGYDAFSLDNTRHTLSDQPGKDRQKTTAISFDANWALSSDTNFQALLSHANSDFSYGYDEDWTYPGICDNTVCDSDLFGFDWWYASTDRYDRDNINSSIDLRIKGSSEHKNWVLGFYNRQQSVDLNRSYTFLSSPFSSQFNTTNRALYGQMSISLTEEFTLESGLRYEQRDAEYSDSDFAQFSPNENLWGGKLALKYHLSDDQVVYGLVSRGYKAGGFNTDGSLMPSEREFDTEFMWNYEFGLKGKYLQRKLDLQLAVFFQQREDVQTKQSIVRSMADDRLLSEGGSCPCSFTDVINNAPGSESKGLEFEAEYRASENLTLFASLGLLDSPYTDYQSFTHVLADPENGVAYDLSGRDQAQAPRHQSTIGLSWWLTDQWRLQSTVASKGSYYFSDRHNVKSESYDTLNLTASYVAEDWEVSIYGRNLTDETIQTRAFGSFGNDPRKFYQTEPYYQLGAPKVIGINAKMHFE